MPKIHVENFDDGDELDDFPSRERIKSRPKEERDKGHRREKTKKHRDPLASERKEYHEER